MNIPWSDDLATGNEVIDLEHKILFERVNQLMEACRVGAGREKIVSTGNFLFAYARTHFAHEEELCQKYNFQYELHKKFHDDFTIKITKLHNNLNTPRLSMTRLADINDHVAMLISHIRTMDKALAQHIREIDGK